MTTLPTASWARTGRMLAALARPRGWSLAGVTILFAAETAVTLTGPPLLGAIVDVVTSGGPVRRIDRLAGAYLAVTVVGVLLAWLAAVRAATVGEDVLRDLRERTLDHAVDLPLATAERVGVGQLLSRLTGDVEELSDAVRYAVPDVTLSLVTLALTAGALVLLSPPLAAVALVGLPLALLAGRRYLRVSPGVYRDYRARHARLVTGLHEAFEGARTIRALRREPTHLARIRQASETRLDSHRDGIRARNHLRSAVTATQFTGLAAVLAAGAALVAGGQVTVGVVTAAALYVLRLVEPLGIALEWLDELQLAGASLARVAGLLDTQPDGRGGTARPAGSHLRLRGVRFGYRPDLQILHGIDLDIAAGTRVAVVGPSGAGKSTLAKLIAGVHAPAAGVVEVGGADLADLDPAARRRTVALVVQETHVLTGTLAENLRLARPGASPDELSAALAAVGASAWADRLPQGLDTVVSSGHHRLSPPQAQQLALARVVLADPAIVVLDEATASLDAAAAGHLERRIAAALHGRTVIAVGHRLSIASTADLVVHVDGGRVVEQGPHAELLALGGPYAQLWTTWAASRLT